MDYNVCVVIRHPPYGTVLPAEAYRTIQALQTFERDVTVLFMADGVLTLIDSTDPEPIGMQRLAEAFTSLLWDGVYNYTYVARATTPGTFVVPPTKAEEMYSPEVFGRSASDWVIVE